MREDIIGMSQSELVRLHVVRQCLDQRLKQKDAAEKLRLSIRQLRRLKCRVEVEGDGGVTHRLRGRPSARKISEKIRRKVLELYQSDYYDFGPTLASEKLLERNGIHISDETLRKWLIAEGLRQTKSRQTHRQWRERKHRFGEMVQMDGSHHAWFEGRGPVCALMGYIDDATGVKYGRFYGYEGTLPAMDSLKRYIKRYGIPGSVYLDRHTTYKSQAKPTIEQELRNEESMTQFKRAAHELGIDVIHARSAPAKGRVERSFRTDQDRLVKELRLRKISTIEEANRFLESEYWTKHNARFSVQPFVAGDFHRAVSAGFDLDQVLCKRTEHPVRKDKTIVHKGRLYQLFAKDLTKWIVVEERVNGRLYIRSGARFVEYKAIERRPEAVRELQPWHPPKIPPQNHPWRKPFLMQRIAVRESMALTST